MTSVQPAAVRRKIEAWLADETDDTTALALKTRPEWTGDSLLPISGMTVRVVPCATPLAARAALHDRVDSERLVLLTELSEDELGDGILAYVSHQRVRSVDPWDLVRQQFGGVGLDPALVREGRWAADALTDHCPPGGWPAPTGTLLTRDHALRCLASELLSLDRAQIDSAGLLQWTTHAPSVLQFTALPRPTVDGITGYLVDLAGQAASPIMATVRAGHGSDAVALGLLAGVLWRGQTSTEVAVARTRLEPRFGGRHLSESEAVEFRDVAEAWLDRSLDSEQDKPEAQRLLTRAETIAKDIHATGLLAASAVLPSGFAQRLRQFASSVRFAATAPAIGAIASAQDALTRVEEHRSADAQRLETARMAVRLLRWLAENDDSAPRTLLDALDRQVREDGWVDRARLDVFAGDTDPEVAEAYRVLHQAVDARRARHDEQFAMLLAAETKAESQPGSLVLIEDALERVVRPIIAHGRRVLVLLMDGMSVAAATELAESLTRTGVWMELTPGGGPRTGVLAALPTITEVSRCSFFSGRVAVGQQPAELAGFAKLFPGAELLHKGALRAGAGAALDQEVVAALTDPGKPLIAAVVNTIDDALDRSDPGTIVWGEETIRSVRDLLASAQDRVVVILSDHGHVIDRASDARTMPSSSSENRWRPADTPPGGGEVLISGSRVAMGGGSVVLPWREELRYGPRKAGYHGGASPAEVVIPLLVLSAADENAVPGWSGAPVSSPGWWREPVSASPPLQATPPAPTKRSKTKPAGDALFELAPPPAPPPVPVKPVGHSIIDALIASAVYQQRRPTRAPLPDERVAALLTVLLDGNGRATMENLAAQAGVPVHRIGPTITALRKLLQVEGYPVIDLDPDGQTVLLNAALLTEQFQLGAPS